MQSIPVLGTPLLATNYAEFTAHCQELTRLHHATAVDLTNTQIVTMRRHEPLFREITSRFEYFVPDGMPLIWALNRRGAGMKDRVYGPKFMRHCMLNSPAPFTHYLLGGSPDCLRALEEKLTSEQPQLRIVGRRNGYFGPEEEPEILAEITALSPDFVWVGLGTPKQQDWIHRHKASITRGVIFAVGFAFDVNAGTKPDAPAWMQKRGLTWLFRLASEPRRLLTRYLRYNSLFLFYLGKDAISPTRR
ncbi:MAG: WecB/TagA/CpsF family glycosyltransferase [Chthoniobacterales bacterium]|nr:WecB/TagA/CpsF family glycosyltransferase [Chthoniobacterales bacterium]